MDIVFLIIGLSAGIAIGYLIRFVQSGNKSRAIEIEKLKLQDDVKSLEEENREIRSKAEGYQSRITDLSSQLAANKVQFDNLNKKLEEREEDLNNIQEKFRAEFRNLAQEILEEKSRKFTDQNKSNLGELLNPLKEKITLFEKKIEDSSKENLERNTALKEQIASLKELNIQITKEAENLVKALKGDSKAQGNWGEMVLEGILDKSGLRKNEEYFVQESAIGEDGRRYQPDVVIKLPENKNIIIDSKVSLVAYERYINSEDEKEKESHLKNHLLSMRNHIKGLSEKKYQNLYGISGLDFVLLFVPVEPAFSLAVQSDGLLFNEAYEKNIVIVSPTTLIATLRTIHSIWRQEYQNQNAIEIARQSGMLYDKFVGFTEDLLDIGKKLKSTKESYDGAMNKLATGTGNLIKRTEDLKKLGAKASKKLDDRLIQKSIDE